MSSDQQLTDAEIKTRLKLIDQRDDIDVSRWEADFINSVAFTGWRMSDKQREKAMQIIEKYED